MSNTAFYVPGVTDLTQPFGAFVVNTYAGRSVEGILVLRGGQCPFYKNPKYYGTDQKAKCNHCSLPLSQVPGGVAHEYLRQQIDTGLAKILATVDPCELRTISMFNGGIALDTRQIPKESMLYLAQKIAMYKNEGVSPNLSLFAIETRETHVNSSYIQEIQHELGSIVLECVLGLESSDEAVRNGEPNNQNGKIGLNKGIKLDLFERSVETCVKNNVCVKSYVMLGCVPWLKDEGIWKDVANSVQYLYDLENRLGTTIHINLNPMYAAQNSELGKVWTEEIKNGGRLPTYWDIVRSLELVHRAVRPIGTGKGEHPIRLGMDSEGFEQSDLFTRNGDETDSPLFIAFQQFNLDQNLDTLLELEKRLRKA